MSTFGDDPARNLTTGRGINKEVIDGLLNVQKTLETNVSGLLSRSDYWRVKSHSLKLFSKQDKKLESQRKIKF